MLQPLSPLKKEVMRHIEQYVDGVTKTFLSPIEKTWQPSDFLPSSNDFEKFMLEVKELQQSAKELAYDFWIVLIGDTITEEALPTYESWISGLDGVDLASEGGWGNWTRRWTSEENRHGDLLNRYLYLSGRVDMKAVEISTQYLLSDGIDIKTDNDPYRTFVYTSFQELATNISHRRVATLAKQAGNKLLSKICGVIAAEEAKHAKAYMTFIEKIFEVDPNEMMIAFADMMKKRIVMPAHNLREVGVNIGETFVHFSNSAQRLGVYTSADYIDIMEKLITDWEIDKITDLQESGEKARDFIVKLPNRMRRVLSRLHTPELEYEFSWINPR